MLPGKLPPIMATKTNSPEELKVFISNRESTCGECQENLGHQAWIFLNRDKGALCLACADLDHLVFLSAGDAALTRRSKKHSSLSAVVLKWSRTRKRYERQGLLVEEEALEKAEAECLADAEVRERRSERETVRREELDQQYVEQFSRRIQEIFPGCPAGRERAIAEHACLKYSGRVDRAAFAKKLDEEAIRLAVIAHLRHTETDYDEYLMRGYERGEARDLVREKIGQQLEKWEK